jgi:hypothetical protein
MSKGITIILSAFGDKLRSMPIVVPETTGRYYKMAVLPDRMPLSRPWALGSVVCTRELTFIDCGKREYEPDHRWTLGGEIRVYELEVPE